MKIPIYADEIETAYDTVKESYPLAVAKKITDYDIEFYSEGVAVALLSKGSMTGGKAKLEWNRERDALSKYER